MRRNAVLAALCLAPPALAAPVPIVLIQGLEAVAGAAHPPAPVAPGARNPPSLGDPEDSTGMLVIDNRPLTPSPTVNPSIVLASVKPIETTYLLGLASATATATTKPAPPKEKEDVVVLKDGSEIPKDLLTAVRSSTIAQMEIGMEETATKTTMPCIYSQLSREYHDMLVISLVVAFLLVVVAVEMWETVRNSARRVFSGQGAIRLEISGSSPPQQPLSIQSDAPTSEKPRL